MVLFVLNDNLLVISNVKNESTGALISDATVTATVKTVAGANVAGQSWPLTLSAAGNGKYEGTIESTISLAANTTYIIEWDIVKGALVAHGETIVKAETRR